MRYLRPEKWERKNIFFLLFILLSNLPRVLFMTIGACVEQSVPPWIERSQTLRRGWVSNIPAPPPSPSPAQPSPSPCCSWPLSIVLTREEVSQQLFLYNNSYIHVSCCPQTMHHSQLFMSTRNVYLWTLDNGHCGQYPYIYPSFNYFPLLNDLMDTGQASYRAGTMSKKTKQKTVITFSIRD